MPWPRFFICLICDLFGLNKVTNQGQGHGYMVYLDAILIYSRTEKELLELLETAFNRLLTAGIKIKLSKCSFFKEQIHYLGHLVSGTSILPLAEKIKALMKLKPLNTVKEVGHFIGLTGCCCKFICSYTDIAHPLNCFTHKLHHSFGPWNAGHVPICYDQDSLTLQ